MTSEDGANMARRRRSTSVGQLVVEIDQKLKQYQIEATGLSLREKVLRLVDINHEMRDLGVSVAAEEGLSPTNARERIRAYLLQNVGEIISGEELAVVSGISEYARRVRELRVEQGYQVLTGASRDPDSGADLRPDEYVLKSSEIDTDTSRRWHIANRIRKKSGGAKPRLLEYFKENVQRVVTTEELAYVARAAQYPRRIRELRTEEGYAIATRFTGRPELGMGEYIMLSTKRVAKPHDRHIPLDVQQEVYARDENTCQLCGWTPQDWRSEDPRILELHHRKPHVEKGENIAANLIVLCSHCHDEVHAGRAEA